MGVFISVYAPGVHCPFCNAEMSDVNWQSKQLSSGKTGPVEPHCQMVSMSSEFSGEIHEQCHVCHIYVQLDIVNGVVMDARKRGAGDVMLADFQTGDWNARN